jgi:hypothetical protein
VSKIPFVGDVNYRAFVLMRAIVASPEDIASFCREAMSLSQQARARIVRSLELEEQLRLSDTRRQTKAHGKRASA